MPATGFTIVSARAEHGAADGPSASRLTAMKAAGFTSLLWTGGDGLFADPAPAPLMAVCREAGLELLVAVDLRRLPADHPLVAEHPDRFSIRRDGAGAEPVDPRRARPVTGEALARLSAPCSSSTLLPAIIARLREWADAGVAGLRLLGAPLPLEVVEALRRELPHVVLIGGPGEDRGAARALLAAGLDGWVTSYAWWDFRSPWLLDEAAALAGAGTLIAEVGEQAGAGDEPRALNRALAGAAATAGGVIVPLALAERDPEATRAALAAAGEVAGFDGEMRRLSGSGAPVTALLRADAPDVRTAREALLVLVNTTAEPQPLPPGSELLPAAGADFAAFAGLTGEPLAAGEVRLLRASRAEAIVSRGKSVRPAQEAAARPRLVLENVAPAVAGGDFPVKRVVGDRVTVEAECYGDGHEQLACELRWRAADDKAWVAAAMEQLPNDKWRAAFDLARLGGHEFVVEGWLDRFGGFRRDFRKKLDADVAQKVDYQEGRNLVAEAVERCKGRAKAGLERALKAIDKATGPVACAAALLDDELKALMWAADDRPHRITSAVHRVDAERLQARFASWYELFPRSMSGDANRHGTFADVIEHLPRVRAMGFDTLYFPPIHPIGRTNRKGPNNTLTAGPDDPGSPYAIGAPEGGHDAIHPELGSFEGFGRLVAAAREQGLEIALDFAIQCSPDHPWLKDHPGWFAWRPDGSMKYAENPPKKYQDIVNVDFYGPDAVPGLWTALRDVVLLWVSHGVKIFRVDNPHTKPLPFWEWMIREVRDCHPDVIFLAEAFTRPTMMYRLGKIGFSQSYTYFTWRDHKQELTDYIVELTTTAPKDFYRPHFFVNTPDINPIFLQTSGRPGFRIRAVLAATLSGLFGVYSGFELCEAAPIPGKEEYLDSEKYIVKPRDWNAPGNIIADITLLNRLRHAHPALQTHLNTRFYKAGNDKIIWYGKPSPDGGDMIMVMVNMDPHHAQECWFDVPLWEFGLGDDASIAVEDLVGGGRFYWHGRSQHIRLEPDEPYRLFRLDAALTR